MDAFKEAFETEMRGAAEDSWYDLLCWMKSPHLGWRPDKAQAEEFRARARDEVSRGVMPPWPEEGEEW